MAVMTTTTLDIKASHTFVAAKRAAATTNDVATRKRQRDDVARWEGRKFTHADRWTELKANLNSEYRAQVPSYGSL